MNSTQILITVHYGAAVIVAVLISIAAPVIALRVTRIEPRAEPAAAAAGKRAVVDQAAVEPSSASCGSCHTLAAAGTSGTIGPNLDTIPVNSAAVLEAIENGGGGTGGMPAGLLQGEEAKRVAELVAGE